MRAPRLVFAWYPTLAQFRLALVGIAVLATCGYLPADAETPAFAPLDYQIKLEPILHNTTSDFSWYHPRATPIPALSRAAKPVVLLTLQRHLRASDHYSGLYDMLTSDLGRTWSRPRERAELAWVREADLDLNVADVTPGWHAPSTKVLAIGASVRYTRDGQEAKHPRANQTGYAVYEPKSDTWTRWREVELPDDQDFDFARSACAQWVVHADGTVLLPFYFGSSAKGPWRVAVVQCSFDGKRLKYLAHGNVLEHSEERGLYEPSLIRFDNRYFLTIRHDTKSFVAVGTDGLNFAPAQDWKFDDDQDLGSYNTQQHWLAHSEGLLLVYTRRNANNDHIERHRAPLFVAQIDPVRLRVLRSTERILIPERGAELGNFGAAAINSQESWVTVSEGVWNDDARRRGAKGATFVARILWSKPNLSVAP